MEGISLPLFSDSEHGCRTVEVLAQTSTPVRRLIIPVRRRVGAKRTLPTAHTHLTHVEALHIVALLRQHNIVCVFLPSLLYHSSGYIRAGWRGQATLLAPASLFEAFVGLRFLTFMASGVSR